MMFNIISRSFNWITGGSFQETFCFRVYKQALIGDADSWSWAIVNFLDWIMREPDHCLKEWDEYENER